MGLKMISPLRVIFLHLPRNLLDSRKQDLLKEGLMSWRVKGNHTTLVSIWYANGIEVEGNLEFYLSCKTHREIW